MSHRFKHPDCECREIPEEEQEEQTISLANALAATVNVNLGGNLDICNRQARMSLLMVLVGDMDKRGYSDDKMRVEVTRCLEIVMANRSGQQPTGKAN